MVSDRPVPCHAKLVAMVSIAAHEPVTENEAISLVTADRKVVRLAPVGDACWRAIMACAGLAHMLPDPRFQSMALRRLFRAELAASLRPLLRECTWSEWIETAGERMLLREEKGKTPSNAARPHSYARTGSTVRTLPPPAPPPSSSFIAALRHPGNSRNEAGLETALPASATPHGIRPAAKAWAGSHPDTAMPAGPGDRSTG